MMTFPSKFVNQIILGDSIQVMRDMPKYSVDLIVTDPPYLVGYKDKTGRTFENDDNTKWLMPSCREMYRVLKPNSFCVSFYGWFHVEKFMWTWKKVGFTPIGHIAFVKEYPSKIGFLGSRHEMAFVFAKGFPEHPQKVLKDVMPWKYTGNTLHPTQKPISCIRPLINAFSKSGDLILDPFVGSATTAVAAQQIGRNYLCIEKDPAYHRIAQKRLDDIR